MKILWICALPLEVQRTAFGNRSHGAQVEASWIPAHLPPPPNIDLHLACLWPGGHGRKTVDYNGAKVHLLPCPPRGRSLLFFQRDTSYFRPLFEELRPKVVHGWGTEDSFGLVARRLAPTHHLIGIQGLISAYRKRISMHPRTFLTGLTERLTLARARYVVAESEYSIREAQPLCPANAKFFVIEHPLRPEFLAAAPSGGTGKTVLVVGAIEERKGISHALHAFAESVPQDWKLHVIGSGVADQEQSMHRLAQRLGLERRFLHTRFCGADQIAQLMQTSSVFLLPTLIDTGPTALKEALTVGLWPVCYDNSGPREYIRKYDFGSLAVDNNLESLTENLRRILDLQPWRTQSKRSTLESRTKHDFSPTLAWSRLAGCYDAIATE